MARSPKSKGSWARRALVGAMMIWRSTAGVGPLSTSEVRPAGLSEEFEAVPLGQIRVTHYTHKECASRITSSGYSLKDEDSGRVCAISRDWWRSKVKPGDLGWIEGHA